MTGCSAINCTQRSENGVKMYVVPTNKNDPRRAQWIVNSRRTDWIPNRHSYFCEKHFEESQFEMISGIKKLRKNAIPTLFEVLNPPTKIDKSPRKSEFKRQPIAMKTSIIDESDVCPDNDVDVNELRRSYITIKVKYEDLQKKFNDLKNEHEILKSLLKEENNKLKQQLADSKGLISKLVIEDQV